MTHPKIAELREDIPQPYISVIDQVWKYRSEYLRWPTRPHLFAPGVARDVKYHHYTPAQLDSLKHNNIRPDRRSNGPAIMSFLVAGGERPMRETGRGWHIHHIYDGKFPLPPRKTSSHAVKEPSLFSEAAGLVAAHPIADALADELAYFAWLLRYEAFRRFGFDPDGVFDGPP